jgi:regulator of sigma E protease
MIDNIGDIILFSSTALAQTAEQGQNEGGFFSLITMLAAFFVMLIVLVFVHELGHFVVANWMKIRVEEFGIGYPPRALTLFQHKGVRYTLNWLPLGGFVRFSGEDNSVYGAGSLSEASPARKIPVMLAGPLMNLFLAVVIFAVMFAAIGVPDTIGQRITEVYPQTPAREAGFQPQDIILSLDNQSVEGRNAITEIGRQNSEKRISAMVLREGKEQELTVTPASWTTPDGQTIDAGFGFQYRPEVENIPVSIPGAVIAGVAHTGEITVQIVKGFGKLIAGLFQVADEPAQDGVVGPIGIARATGEIIDQKGFEGFFHWMAILSITLFFINLLPIPALDGGHILFALIEWARGGKKIPPEKEAIVNAISFLTLMGLILLVSVGDVISAIRGIPVLGG